MLTGTDKGALVHPILSTARTSLCPSLPETLIISKFIEISSSERLEKVILNIQNYDFCMYPYIQYLYSHIQLILELLHEYDMYMYTNSLVTQVCPSSCNVNPGKHKQ